MVNIENENQKENEMKIVDMIEFQYQITHFFQEQFQSRIKGIFQYDVSDLLKSDYKS